MSDPPQLRALPESIQRKLDALASRIRRVVFIRGALATLAVATAALVLLMAIDAGFMILSTPLRFSLSIAALLVVTATAWLKLIRPLRQKYSPSEIARIIESRHPELEARISTAVELLAKGTPDADRGSDELLGEVVKAAELDARVVLPRREFSSKKALRYALAALFAGGIIGAAFYLWPKPTTRLVKRAIMPTATDGNFFADQIIVTPGSLQVAEGEPLSILVETPAEHAELRTKFSDSTSETIERMSSIPNNGEIKKFSITFPSVSKSFQYRVRSNKALSEAYQVKVIPRPVVEKISITYRYPEYTGLAEKSLNSPTGAVTAIDGTTAIVSVLVDRPMKLAALHINEAPIWVNSQSAVDGKPVITWTVPLQTEMTGVWKVALEDFDGIRNLPIEYSITVTNDTPPELKIVSPETDHIDLKPSDSLSIGYIASDDFGIRLSGLQISTLKMPDGEFIPLPLEIPERKEDGTYTGEALVTIADLQLDGARDFQLKISITDGFGQETLSKPLFISVRTDAQSLLEQSVAKQAEEFGKQLWSVLQKLTEAKELSAHTPETFVKLGDEPIPQPTLDTLAQTQLLIADSEAEAASTAQQMSGTLFTRQAQELNTIVSDYIIPARQSAEVIPLSDNKINRVHKSRLLVRHLEDAIDALQNTLRSLQQNAGNARMLSQMNELTDKQRELAELMADPRNKELLPDLQEEQLALSSQMKQLVAENAQSFTERFVKARSDADQLADKAKSLAEDQQALADMLENAMIPEQREEATLDMFQWLESQQREIGTESKALTQHVEAGDEAILLVLKKSSENSQTAASQLRENVLDEAAQAALGNVVNLESTDANNPAMIPELQHLIQWQTSVANQIQALAASDLDSALAAMQARIADQSDALAQQTSAFQQDAAQLAASQAMQQAASAASQISAAAAAAAAAGAQLGGQAFSQFRFANTPGNAPPGTNIPANLPPAATIAALSENIPQRTVYGNNAVRANTDLPPDLAMLDGTAENPFSIGESFLDTFPPAVKDEAFTIQGGNHPPDYIPPGEQIPPTQGGGVSIAAATGMGSALGSAIGAAQGAASGLSGAANALATAAQNLQAPQAPDMDTPDITAAMEKTMEAETPREAAEAAKEAAVAMQSMMTQMSAERAEAMKNWQRVRGQVKSGVATESKGATPDEYKDLVKRYFEEIAKRETNNAP
jgi:hypothetical protein